MEGRNVRVSLSEAVGGTGETEREAVDAQRRREQEPSLRRGYRREELTDKNRNAVANAETNEHFLVAISLRPAGIVCQQLVTVRGFASNETGKIY